MDAQDAIDLGREAIRTCMMIGGPILAISLVIGLVISIMQAMTQVQDQTVSFVPKLILVLVAIAVCLPWLSDRMLEFSHEVLSKPMMMAHGSEIAGEWSASVKVHPVAWPSVQPVEAQRSALLPGEQNAPAWLDQDETHEASKSPFQLPHYRFSRKPTDDLEG